MRRRRNTSLGEGNDGVGEAAGFVFVVGGEDNADAGSFLGEEIIDEAVGERAVEVGKGFVEQE